MSFSERFTVVLAKQLLFSEKKWMKKDFMCKLSIFIHRENTVQAKQWLIKGYSVSAQMTTKGKRWFADLKCSFKDKIMLKAQVFFVWQSNQKTSKQSLKSVWSIANLNS